MPTFDCPAIQAAVERGMTATEIANTMPNVPTRQAIQNRIDKEGWQVAERTNPMGPVTSRDIVLNRLRNGVSFEVAAAASGFTDRTIRRWREDDPSFDEACRAARAAFLASKVEQINEAGDWKAAAYLLERAPETKDQYSQKHEGGNTIIVLNIDRTDGLKEAEGVVIEHDVAR